MARRADPERIIALAEAVRRHPNLRPSELAAELHWHRSSVTRCLPILEEMGILLMEDETGRLSHFSPFQSTDSQE